MLCSCPQWPCLAQSEVEKDHLPVTSLRPQGMGCVQSYVQSLFPGPREAQLACLAAPATNPSPTLSMAGSGYLGQSSQGPRLPQAFQELGSEVTDCPGQGGEQCSDRNFPFGVLDRESGTCA